MLRLPPLFAVHTGRRPWGLILIALIFTLNGLGIIGELINSFGPWTVAQSLRVFGFLYIAAGVGLLYLSRPLRILALILVWIQLIIGVLFAMVILFDDKRENFWALLVILFPIWEYAILVRHRNRAVFGLTQPMRFRYLFGVSAAILCALVFGLPLLINLPDQDVDAVAQVWAKPGARPTMESTHNRYYAFIGFSAVGDAHTAGLQLWRQYKQTAQHRIGPSSEEDQGLAVAHPRAITGDKKQMCRPADKAFSQHQFESACLTHYGPHQRQIQMLLTQNQELLNRYLQEINTREEKFTFLEPDILVDAYPRSSQLMIDMHYLAQAHAISVFSTHPLEAVTLLLRDLHYWRMAMAGSCHLITKMISTRMVISDVALLLEMAQAQDTNQAVLQAIAAALSPLTSAERDMTCPIQLEFRLMKERIEHARNLAEAFNITPTHWTHRLPTWMLLIKPGASINLLVDDFRPWIKLASADGWALNETMRAPAPPLHWRFSHLYNLGGRILVSIMGVGDGIFARYVQRIHDTDALLRLLRLQTEIRLQRVQPTQMDAFLHQAVRPDWYFNDPYTRDRLRWDAGTKRLFSVGYQGQNRAPNRDDTVGITVTFSP